MIPPYMEQPQDWICEKCDYKNFAKRQKCHKCDRPKSQACKGFLNSALVLKGNIGGGG